MHTQRTQLLRESIAAERRTLSEARASFVMQPCPDDNETATMHEILNNAAILLTRTQQRLRVLEQSVTLIESHPQPTCIDCGEEIPLQRLAAQPDALRCTQCQEDWELEQRLCPVMCLDATGYALYNA